MNLSAHSEASSTLPGGDSHLHVHAEQCPVCDQTIPREKYALVKGRMAARDQAIVERLMKEFATERAEANAKARTEFDHAQRQSAAALEQARSEAALREAAALERGKNEAKAAVQEQLAAADSAKVAALAQAEATKHELQAASVAIEQLRNDAAAKEIAARERGKKAALDEMHAQLSEAQKAKVEADTARDAALADAERARKLAGDATRAAQEQLEALKSSSAAELERVRQEGVVRASAARDEGKRETEAAMQPQLLAAEQKLNMIQAAHDNLLNQRLQEQREAIEKESEAKLNAERSRAFEERQKLETTVQHLQRQLQNQTAQELGEGAEVDLFEVLKAEFPDDDVCRIGKGAPGADIRHEVCHNGKVCGLIVYDSKNHKQWRYEFVSKLRDDQLADKADHAILSTQVFPANTRQLHHHDGVIIAQPARVVAVVKLLRLQLVNMHVLRTSNEERERKTDELYAFITSERFANMLKQVDGYTADILELDAKEVRAHQRMWNDRGELSRNMQKAHGKLHFEIERIIGTIDTPAAAP